MLETNQPSSKFHLKNHIGKIVIVILLIVIGIVGAVLMLDRYMETDEHMALDQYFVLTKEDAAAVIINTRYYEQEEETPYAIISEDAAYLQLTFLKNVLDDGYVYDSTENILRYTTDKQIFTAFLDRQNYLVDQEEHLLEQNVIISAHDTIYLHLDFVQQLTDLSYQKYGNPNRVIIETAGFEKVEAILNKDTGVRRFGGPKSLILEDGIQGEKVIVLEDYGRWSSVLTENGVIGCVKNRCLSEQTDVITPSLLPEREYSHLLLEQPVKIGWHQTFRDSGVDQLDDLLATAEGLNVISPTWYGLSDNDGSVTDLSDASYVQKCHDRGIQVWVMVSNVDLLHVDSTRVLNTTSSRDALIQHLITDAVSDGVDGINVDMEALSVDAKDGFIEFIRELSLRCKEHQLILSVDNYKPENHTAFYNRFEQAKYADYIIVMAYDEHNRASEVAGSTASINFVRESAEDTLLEVPSEQLILGLPFYTRVWKTSDAGLQVEALGMQATSNYIEQHGLSVEWLEDKAQNYTEYEKDGVKTQIWIEDNESMARKLQIYQEYNLAGVAFWKLGFEPASTWEVIRYYVD